MTHTCHSFRRLFEYGVSPAEDTAMAPLICVVTAYKRNTLLQY